MILENRTAIITGGARGMGRAIALRFASEGCSSVIADVLDEDAAETVKMVEGKGRKAAAVHCDVSSGKSVREMVGKAIDQFGKIDFMINCAGIGKPPKLINDITEEEYDRVVDINMKGIFLCCQAIAPHMKANNYGKIVNISSLAGIVPAAFSIHYAAAKAGALALTQDIALELAKYHVNVNAILPGMIRTAMTADFAPTAVKDLDSFMNKMAEGIPLKREGTVEDIASAALFLISEESSYITGDRLCVGGGMPWSGAP
ncbi:MAG: SDR family oxidoreductase [Dehalococcoidales bacterium]|nr:SDR family oxidoreductase [Dehalococcoidales bacterium]